jgi:pimeloyl-ACP methyl ester carboxylesterase
MNTDNGMGTATPVVLAHGAPLPLTSLSDDLAALDRVLDRVDGPALVVGHAYAGAVIGSVQPDKVSGLVYIAALAPDEGETVADVFYRAKPHPRAPELTPDANGLIWLPDMAFSDAFAQDASHEDHALLASVQRPIAVACITAPVGEPAWRTRPSWYFVAEEDRMIPPETQHYMAERMHATVTSMKTDHIPLITASDQVTDVIMEALAETARAR